MSGLSLFALGAAPVLLLVAVGAYLIYHFRFRTTPISPVHAGKKDTCRYKFDPAETRKRDFRKKPKVDVSNLPAKDSRVTAVLNAITTGDVEKMLMELSGEADATVNGAKVRIASRSSYNKLLDTATKYLEQFYAGLGIKTTRVKYTWRGKQMWNLEAVIPGASQKVVIVGAHLDSTAGSTWKSEPTAPGADDDASGTVALLKIAEALVALKKGGAAIGHTIRLVHFTGEEQGLWGSYTYSDKVANENTDVIAVLQMDMIGYRKHDDMRVDLHDEKDRNGSHSLVVLLTRAAAQYGLNLQPFDTHNLGVKDRSDHAGFLDHGYKALCISEEFAEEDDKAFNPNYHSVNDRVKSSDGGEPVINLAYMVEIIRMLLAGVVELAAVK